MSRPGLVMPIDAAIVLGAGLRRDGTPGAATIRRVAKAVELYGQGGVGRILMSGGPVRHPHPEAEAMRDLARAQGVPDEALFVETQAMDTLGNALYCTAIARAKGWRRVALVTDGYHLPRALYAFRRLGLPATGVAASSRGGWAALAREAAAIPVYFWRVEAARRRHR